MAIAIILILLIIAALVMTFVFLLPEKRRAHLSPFWLRVHDFLSMKQLYLEKILRTFYIIASVITFTACIGAGIMAPFLLPERSFGSVVLGIPLGLLAGAIAAIIMLFFTRIFYENVMLKIMLTKAAKSLEQKFAGGSESRSYEEPRRRLPAPRPVVCRRCGARFDPRRGYCPNCDERW